MASSGGGEVKGKGKGGKLEGKGKNKVQVCYSWHRDDGGCPAPCQNGRAHLCEVCGAVDHKGKNCPTR